MHSTSRPFGAAACIQYQAHFITSAGRNGPDRFVDELPYEPHTPAFIRAIHRPQQAWLFEHPAGRESIPALVANDDRQAIRVRYDLHTHERVLRPTVSVLDSVGNRLGYR
jgi:hypothetical protein